jgi:GPH family glycoside/pentoside/hexuronide:cation symporter
VVLFFLALIIMVTITLRTTSAAYYFKYVVGRPELMQGFVPAYMISAGRRRLAHAVADALHRQEAS